MADLYNTTFFVTPTAEEDFLRWAKEVLLPTAKRQFAAVGLYRVKINRPDEMVSYCLHLSEAKTAVAKGHFRHYMQQQVTAVFAPTEVQLFGTTLEAVDL